MKYSILILLAVACGKAQDRPTETLVSVGSDNPIVKGARKFVKRPFDYDLSMSYRPTVYRDGQNTGALVYPNGDIDPTIGVCTDLIVRAFREAGYDLQKLVHEDAQAHFTAYPYSRYDMTRTDANIDHRRVPMLTTFFKRFALELPTDLSADSLDQWKAGDIVVWDLQGNGNLDHIGIVSDKRLRNRPLVIDNFPDPGYVYEGDRLDQWVIRHHFRFPKP